MVSLGFSLMTEKKINNQIVFRGKKMLTYRRKVRTKNQTLFLTEEKEKDMLCSIKPRKVENFLFRLSKEEIAGD